MGCWYISLGNDSRLVALFRYSPHLHCHLQDVLTTAEDHAFKGHQDVVLAKQTPREIAISFFLEERLNEQ